MKKILTPLIVMLCLTLTIQVYAQDPESTHPVLLSESVCMRRKP